MWKNTINIYWATDLTDCKTFLEIFDCISIYQNISNDTKSCLSYDQKLDYPAYVIYSKVFW